jgi:hypothetical protein
MLPSQRPKIADTNYNVSIHATFLSLTMRWEQRGITATMSEYVW